jgi:hypothetical protein
MDNYATRGNVNPYIGAVGTRNLARLSLKVCQTSQRSGFARHILRFAAMTAIPRSTKNKRIAYP